MYTHTYPCTSLQPLDEYSNMTACQLLANMCVMTLYSQRYSVAGSLEYDACALHQRLLSDELGPATPPFPPHNSGEHLVPQW